MPLMAVLQLGIKPKNQCHWIEIITESMQIPKLWIEDPVGIGHPHWAGGVTVCVHYD